MLDLNQTVEQQSTKVEFSRLNTNQLMRATRCWVVRAKCDAFSPRRSVVTRELEPFPPTISQRCILGKGLVEIIEPKCGVRNFKGFS